MLTTAVTGPDRHTHRQTFFIIRMYRSTKIGKIREIEFFDEIFASTTKMMNSTKIGKICEIETFEKIFASMTKMINSTKIEKIREFEIRLNDTK